MINFRSNPVGLYEKALPAGLRWDDRLRLAGDAGYDFVEMSIDDSEERLARLESAPAARSELRHIIEDSGVPVLTMGVSGHRKFALGSASPQVRTRALDILYRSIELAYDLGVQVIQLMGYDVYDEISDTGTQARFLEGLCQGASWASAAGVMLALENVDVDTINSVEKALRFVQAANSPWLKLYPDIGNMTAAGYDPVEQLRLAEGYLVGVHIKDARPGEVRGVGFGQGIVQFEPVFQTLLALDFHGPLVVEMWAHLDTTGDPMGAAASARQFVGRFLQAGSHMPGVQKGNLAL